MTEPLGSTSESDVSSSYQSDKDVTLESFLATSSESHTPESTDSEDCRGMESRAARFSHMMNDEWEELLNTNFKANAGRVMTFPKAAGEYARKNHGNILNGLGCIGKETTAVLFICDSLRTTLNIYEHRRKPSNHLFDVCIFRVNRPNLVISIQNGPEIKEDTVYYNTKLARGLTGSIRSHTVVNFNLVHGVLLAGSEARDVESTVAEWEQAARRDYQAYSLNMDEQRCSDVVKHFSSLIPKSEKPDRNSVTEKEKVSKGEISTSFDEGHVEMEANKIIRNKLKQHGFITITGLPGDGKTYHAHILSKEYRKLGYKLLLMNSVAQGDLEALLNDEQKYICLFDDIFKNDQDTENLKSQLNLLMLHPGAPGFFIKETDRKFLMIFTSQVYNLCQGIKSLLDRSMFLPETIINLSKIKYSSSETRNIFLSQCRLHKKDFPEETDLEFVSVMGQNMPGFPLICKLYFEGGQQSSCRDFFTHPYAYYQRVFDNIIKSKSTGFAAAAFVFLSKKAISLCAVEEDFDDGEMISKLRDFVPNVTMTDICNAIRRFKEIFFTPGDIITFQNDVIYEAFACSLFELNPGLVLQNCSMKFLCDRVTSNIVFETFIDEQNAIHLSDNYHDIVATRLTNEIEEGHFRLALSHQLLVQESIVENVFSNVKFEDLKSLFDEGKHLLYWAVKLDSPALLKRVIALLRVLRNEIQDQCIEACLIHGDQTEDYVVVTYGERVQVSLIDACLLLAVELKCLKVAKFLLTNGASISTINRKKQNVLHLACVNNHEDMVMLIIKHSDDESLLRVINVRDGSQLTPLMIAVLGGNGEMFNILRSIKADPSMQRYSDTLLHLGCEGGNKGIVEYLIKVFDVNSRGEDCTTPLMRAAGKGDMNVSDLLLSHNADPGLKDRKGDLAIHYACRGGSVTVVSRLVTLCDINVRGCDGVTPVMTAALAGDKEIFQFLLASKSDLTKSDSHNNTVIHHASRGGNCDIVKSVLSPSNINSRGEHGRTPVMMAAANGHSELLDYLISENADLSVTDKNNTTILHIAFDKKNEDIIASIKRHVDINHRDVHGRTPLMIAAMTGNYPAFKCLLDNNANPSLSDYRHNTLQHLACIGGNMDIVKRQLTTGKDTPGVEAKTPIMKAAEAGQFSVVKFLISKGVNFKMEDANGNNMLHLACRSGSKSLVENLIYHFSINSKGVMKQTPLMIAALYGHTDLFKFLITKGASVSLKDTRGNTCLDLACKSNRVDIIEYLLAQKILEPSKCEKRVLELAAEYGLEVMFFKVLEMRCDGKRKKLKYNGDILHKACKGGNFRIVQYILRHERPAVNGRDTAGGTPVMITAERGYTEVFHLLIEEGCDLSLTDKNGNTVLHSACRGSNKDIVKYILSKGWGSQMINRRRISDGFTPVMVCIAAMRYSEDIFSILASHGFDFSLTDNVGNTILHLATKYMRPECIKYLLQKGLDIKAENKAKATPESLTAYTHSGIQRLFQEFRENGGSSSLDGRESQESMCNV